MWRLLFLVKGSGVFWSYWREWVMRNGILLILRVLSGWLCNFWLYKWIMFVREIVIGC